MSALNFMAIHPPAAEIFQLVYSLQAEIYLKRKKKKGRKEGRTEHKEISSNVFHYVPVRGIV